VIGSSGCRFHVEESFHTGKSASRLAGGFPPVASIVPVHRRHQRKSFRNHMYSPPTFKS
jgi:hypothetical protein